MNDFFTPNWHYGKGGILKKDADTKNRLEAFWNFLRGENGVSIRKDASGFPVIYLDGPQSGAQSPYFGQFFLATEYIDISGTYAGEGWWCADLMAETVVWQSSAPSFPLDDAHSSYHYGRADDAWPIHLPRAG